MGMTMDHNTQITCYTWKPDIVAGTCRRILRRLSFMLLDIKLLYRFWQDGHPVRLTMHGWYVDFSKQQGRTQ